MGVDSSTLEVIPWGDFQKGIAPLWNSSDPDTIPILNNPYRIIKYPLRDWQKKIIFMPCRIIRDGEVLAYTSIYNISDLVTRIRGIYVLPQYRGEGVGHQIWQMASELFPKGFFRTVGFWREDSAPRFLKYSDMKIVPGQEWYWSDYSKVNMRFLYKDRSPRPLCTTPNELFLRTTWEKYGIGGTNNLNRTWTEDEWKEFAEPFLISYPDKQIDVDKDFS